MDQPLDFSFHKGNPLAIYDELESPTPMPKSPPLPITTNAYADHLYEPHFLEETLMADERVASSESVSKMAVEGIEALSISTPALVYSDRNAPFESATRHTATASDGHNAPSVSYAPSAFAALVDHNIAPLMQPVAPAAEQNVPFVSSVPKFVEPRVSPPKPRPRAKVPLERGFTQMNWLKLTRTAPDLAGLKGHTSKRLILMEEVRQHKTNEDAWTVLRGQVYNISPYLRFHPGGTDMLMKGAGKDCTTLFNKYHSWVNAEFLLEKCLVGYLDVEQQRDLSQL